MLVSLPSNGVSGKIKVDVSPVRICDLRSVVNYSEDSVYRKNQFVRDHLTDKSDFDYLTTLDRDYIFVLLTASLNMNKFTMVSMCQECGNVIKDEIGIDSAEVKFYEGKKSVEKEIFGEKYTFNLLMASDEEEIEDYALIDENDRDNRYSDAFVCKTLGLPLNEESIQKVGDLDIVVYHLCYAFQIATFHGIVLSKKISCKCGNKYNLVLAVDGDMLKVDMSIIMNRFVGVSGVLDFNSFQSLTLPEYNSLVSSLNSRK